MKEVWLDNPNMHVPYQEFMAVKLLLGLVVIAIAQLLDLYKIFTSYSMLCNKDLMRNWVYTELEMVKCMRNLCCEGCVSMNNFLQNHCIYSTS